MIEVNPLKESLELSESAEGMQATMNYMVTGLPVDPDFPLADAMISPKLPKFGEPFGRFGIQVVERVANVNPNLSSGAIVSIKWAVPDSKDTPPSTGSKSKPRIEMKVGTISETTLTDIKGDFLKLVYRGTATGGARLTQVQEAEIQKPVFRFTARRDEDKIPFLLAKKFIAKVNSTTFYDFEPKTLLCLGISNTESNKGLTQEVLYEFAWKEDTWRHEARLVLGGRFPADASLGNGLELYDVFLSRDFRELGLSLAL